VLSDAIGTDGSLISGARAGFSTLFTGANIEAVLHALAEKSKINVISSPSLMVLNNHEASINVGDQVPVATSSSTNTNSLATDAGDGTSNAFVTNNIERIDTGVTLIVTPRVNAGGLVVMEIEQEANQVVAGTAGNNNTPTISQRKISSTIAIKNGETVVLGGLIREEQEELHSGVPILHEIPLIGPLFGSTDKNLRKTELVVVITPRVVTSAQDAREITNEFKRKLTGLYEEIKSEARVKEPEEAVLTTHPYGSPQAIQPLR
jgi:general secretion pathway protein D